LGKIFNALDRHLKEIQKLGGDDQFQFSDFMAILRCNNETWRIDINDKSIFKDHETVQKLIENKLILPDGKMTSKGKKKYKELMLDLRIAMAGTWGREKGFEGEKDEEMPIDTDVDGIATKYQNVVEGGISDAVADTSDYDDETRSFGPNPDKLKVLTFQAGQEMTFSSILPNQNDTIDEQTPDNEPDVNAYNNDKTKSDHEGLHIRDATQDKDEEEGSSGASGNAHQDLKYGPIDRNMITILADQSYEAEQFKVLRSNILFPRGGRAPRTILITSADQGDGKSFIAANLAACIAFSMNHHVLLIDGDLRNPNIHRIYGFKEVEGLSQYLDGDAPLSSLIYRTKIDRLSILPAGKIPINPSELLSSKKMEKLLEEVKNRYSDRIIIIDSPPLELTSETLVLARNIDGVILAVRYGKTDSRSLERLIAAIGKEKILGCVLNCFEYTVTDHQYGYKAYRKYGAYRVKTPKKR
jgi:exopolysaccharide/PEP-CTERM locus tyrosine autokinase